MTVLFVCAASDIGMKRSENQDCFLFSVFDDGAVCAVVCDGMGGAGYGSIASGIAVSAVHDRIKQNYRDNFSPMSMKNLLVTAVSAANTLVFKKANEEKEKMGMGTTCVAAIVKNDIAYIASVGDSRAYHLSDDGIEQVTVDHTYVELLYEQGKINKEEISTHDMRHYITKAVGVEKDVEVDFFEIDISKGDEIILCSDGLSNYCSSDMLYERIHAKAQNKEDGDEIVASLIDYVNSQGGRDNITLAMICNYDK